MDPTPSLFPDLEDHLARVQPSSLEAREGRAELAVRLENALWSPLQHLRNAAGRLLESDLSEEQRSQAELAVAATQVVMGLLGTHLDLVHRLSEPESEPAVFDPQDILAPVVKAFAARARGRGYELACSFDERLPRALIGYPGRLRRVASVLLEEALRSTRESGVRLDLRLLGGDEQRAELCLVVHGIEDLAQCAEGLAVCKKIAKEHEGDLGFEREGSGSGRALVRMCFERFPDRRRQLRSVGRGKRALCVLLVDPVEASGEALTADLEARGLEVVAAKDLEAALEHAEASKQVVGAALIDALAWDDAPERRLALRRHLGRAPVLLSSRSLSRVLQVRDQDQGVADVLYAPVLPWEFLVALSESPTGSELLSETGFGPPRPAPVGQLDVLLADGNVAHRKHARGLLDRLGHRVVGVSDGLSAFERLDPNAFDMAVLDVDLPGLDAISIARLLRAREVRGGGRLKLIAMSTEPLEDLRVELAEAGIDACLAKPLELDDLAWTVTRLCHGAGRPELGAA